MGQNKRQQGAEAKQTARNSKAPNEASKKQQARATKNKQKTSAEEHQQKAAPSIARATRAKAKPRRPVKKVERMRIIPLGGMDAIGKNMTVFELDDDMIVVDAGLMFPDDDHPGIDLILPDYTYVLEHADKLRGIFITHGHEDHTGALPYLMKDLGVKVPIIGSRLTLGFISGKLDEHKIKSPKLMEVVPGEHVDLGRFSLDVFAVNHSIPGALGVYIRTPAGNVLHTGDFKLDETPIDGVRTDFSALSRWGHTGVDLMMSDSTNAGVSEFTKSEAEVGNTLRPIIRNARQRVIVASFSSHIHRVQQVCDAAVACGRKVVVTGRSMVQNTKIARELGYLNVSDEDIVDAYDMRDLPPEKVVVLCTGSQGEPLSALARMANGEHRTVSIEEGDTVIISATPVPGNEKAVTRVVNGLSKIGADVYDKRRALVHVSGHAGSEELKIVLSIVNPRYFMPVHGEAMHLRSHAKLAEDVGIPRSNIYVLDNGESIVLENGVVRRGEPIETSGVVFVDGLSVGDTSSAVLHDRHLLQQDGVVAVSLAVSMSRRKVLGDPQIVMRGVTGGDDDLLLYEAHEKLEKAVKKALANEEAGPRDIARAARESVSRLLWERCRRRPLVVPSIIEV